MGVIDHVINTLTEMYGGLFEENISYGVFRVTPKRKLLRLVSIYKLKSRALKECEYVTKLNNFKHEFIVLKMTYLFNPNDYIILK